MEGIFDSLKNAALIHKSGGGTGFCLINYAQRSRFYRRSCKWPVSFMKVFNLLQRLLNKWTRGNMGILRVDHPDIMEFITCKQDNADITNFNISVALTEAFMEAVEKGEDYDLINPKNKEINGQLNAREVFDKMVQMAWKNGEPGIVFIDRINRDNITPEIGEIESTNPCGEQPLLPYEACNLGSINLSAMVKSGESGPEVDYDKLRNTVHKAVHFLDNVIDVNNYPLPEIDK